MFQFISMNLIDYVFISLKRILKQFIHLEHITNSSHTEEYNFIQYSKSSLHQHMFIALYNTIIVYA